LLGKKKKKKNNNRNVKRFVVVLLSVYVLDDVGVSYFDVRKAAADSIGHWFQSRLDEGHPDPSDVEENDVKDAEYRCGEPNGEEGDERESNSPNECQWQSE